MFQSRCGVLCDECDKKSAGICKGCPQMEKPFWGGVCEVKVCCENQKLNHCGECEKFACETLANMGAELGYDPKPRLSKCREWKASAACFLTRPGEGKDRDSAAL